MSENYLQKFRDKFIEETITLLDKLESDLLELEKSPEDKEILESAFRAMHTIKGISGMYGFDFISEFTHVLENIYQSLREKKVKFNKEISDVSFESIDHIRKLLEDEKLVKPENIEKHKLLREKINILAQKCLLQTPLEIKKDEPQTTENEQGKQSWYILLNTNEQIFFRGISLINLFKELAELGEYSIQYIPVLQKEESDSWGIVLVSDCSLNDIREVFMFIEDDCQIFRITDNNIFEKEHTDHIVTQTNETREPSLLDIVEGKSNKKSDSDKILADPSDIVKLTQEKHQIKRISVDSEKLDHLMYLVSELITVNSQLMQETKDFENTKLRQYAEQVDNLSKKFRNNALEIRLVPISDLALRFKRLIRDLSKSLGKEVEFVTEGLDTELDKNTIDLLAEPLMHLIRNCIDHGIESPEKRVKDGKSESGTIKFSAQHSGSYIYISIEDDGVGIDQEKVRLKAVEKNIIPENYKPTEKEIYDYIFLPGFSTAQNLTEVSGRGVGMDVVKKNIADLRGDIIVNSKKNVGTTFTLKLQQSVAIIDTLLFKIETTNLLVPMSDIEICIQIPADEIEKRKHNGTIPYNDQLIHFYDLRDLLKISGNYEGNVKVIIIKKNETFNAILADVIVGEHQAVLKPLGKTLAKMKIFSAASQLGNGNLAFMLDIASLNDIIYQHN